MPPLFSIIIPCYNHAIFLKDCLESVINQSCQNWEAIVVNDGSTDETTFVTLNYARLDSRIRLVEKENGGLSSARNCGMKVAVGEWVNFLDADDFLLRDHLRKVTEKIEAEPDIKCIQTGYFHFNEDASIKLHSVLPYMDEIMPDILTQNIGPVHTIVIRKNVMQILGPFDETLNSCEDWDMWIRLGKAGIKKESIYEPLVGYRLVNNSMSRNSFRLYSAMKTVIFRGVKEDDRIEKFPGNTDYHINLLPAIKKCLLKCIGISIMQGKIDESIILYNKELEKYNFTFQAKEFSSMNSYLSFRYLISRKDIFWVFNCVLPNFKSFFNSLGYDKHKQEEIIKIIFKKHIMIRNKKKWGLLSPIINRLYFLHQNLN